MLQQLHTILYKLNDKITISMTQASNYLLTMCQNNKDLHSQFDTRTDSVCNNSVTMCHVQNKIKGYGPLCLSNYKVWVETLFNLFAEIWIVFERGSYLRGDC